MESAGIKWCLLQGVRSQIPLQRSPDQSRGVKGKCGYQCWSLSSSLPVSVPGREGGGRRSSRDFPEFTLSRDTTRLSEAASGSVRNVQLDHRRVNTAFLDTLEGRGKETKEETKSPFTASEDFNYPSHLNPEPEHSYLEWSDEAEPDLKRLIESFPGYSSGFLEDILVQCNRDCEQAYALLLNCAMD
ncbi:hypothetical protein NQZ68_032119 [Dissostichus eleginoides]|nr:hypothetical protein NQZ68_032104 [Dissostichus eleginoides]KAI9519064.1 hypothetical protein NQZ68_032119 [Dissostichus eleginoides]